MYAPNGGLDWKNFALRGFDRTLHFPAQRVLRPAGSGELAAKYDRVMSASSDVFWIPGDPAPGVAIVLRPRGNDWLEDEMSRLRNSGIGLLVSLLEDEEAAELGLSREGELAARSGLNFLSFPIQDRHIPPNTGEFRQFAAGLAARLQAGQRIAVHCRGSIGRASVTAACTLIHLGWRAEAALLAIEAARGCPIPDTDEQRQWILNYEACP